MKMLQDHYDHLAREIAPVAGKHIWEEYYKGKFSPKRYRWDMMRNAGLIPFVIDTLYPYLEDSHIDTALRKITKSHITD